MKKLIIKIRLKDLVMFNLLILVIIVFIIDIQAITNSLSIKTKYFWIVYDNIILYMTIFLSIVIGYLLSIMNKHN